MSTDPQVDTIEPVKSEGTPPPPPDESEAIEPEAKAEQPAEEPQEEPSVEPTEDHFQQFTTKALAPLEPRNLGEAQEVGRIFAASGLFEGVHKMEQAVVKIMAGRELGFGAFASMNNIYFVYGRLTLGAHLMAAKVKISEKYDYRIAEHDNQRCTIVFFEHGKPLDPPITFTMQDATTAGVNKEKSGWQKYPKNMLFARAMSNGVRFHCADLFMFPVYTAEEMGADVDEEGNMIIDVEFTYKPDPDENLGPGTPITSPQRERRMDTTPHTPPKEGKTNRPITDDTPFQDVIAHWTKWTGYWLKMKDEKGLTRDEVHTALGNPVDPETGKVSVKGFMGTWGDHGRLINNAAERKREGLEVITPDELAEEASVEPGPPAQPKGTIPTRPGTPFHIPDPPEKKAEPAPPKTDGSDGKISMADDRGTFTAARIVATAKKGSAPKLTIWGMDDHGHVDDIPVIDQKFKTDQIRSMFGDFLPDDGAISKDGTELYHFEGEGYPDEPMIIEWMRKDKRIEIEDVYLF